MAPSLYCVSHTAPKLSAAEEARELMDITEKEKLQIYKDKYGRCPNHDEDQPIPPCSLIRGIIMTNLDQNINTEQEEVSSNNYTDEKEININIEEEDRQDAHRDRSSNSSNDEVEDMGDSNNDNGNEGEENENEDSDITIEMLNKFFDELTAIPEPNKLEYTTALIYCSDLVRGESNPKVFLRYANYEPRKAALALCSYWRARVDIFEEDAFKPMTLRGAFKSMVPIIANNLKTFIRLLPPDDHGRHVLCCDRTDLNYADIDDHMVIVKYTWFVYHRELTKASIQKNGLVYLLISRGQSNFLKRKALKYIFTSKLPIKFVCGHFCMSSLPATILLPTVKLFVGEEYRRRIELHLSVKLPTIINELAEFGIHSRNLPKSIGGSLTICDGDIPPWIAECESMIYKNNKRQSRKKHSSSSFRNYI